MYLAQLSVTERKTTQIPYLVAIEPFGYDVVIDGIDVIAYLLIRIGYISICFEILFGNIEYLLVYLYCLMIMIVLIVIIGDSTFVVGRGEDGVEHFRFEKIQNIRQRVLEIVVAGEISIKSVQIQYVMV